MSQYVPTYDSFAAGNTDRYVPTERFQVMSNVYLPSSEVDIQTGMLKPDRQRRCRTQGKKLEIERLEGEEQRLMASVARESRKGGVRVSMRFGVLLIVGVLVFCGFAVLIQQGIIAERQKDINTLRKSITEYRGIIADLEEQVLKASSYEVICYAASQNLGMVPASSAEAIHLVAMDTRPLENKATPMQIQETLDLTAEATNAPALASN